MSIYNFKKFANKKILITGHTGFKGAYAVLMMHYFGAKVYGLSDNIVSSPSLYEIANLPSILEEDLRINICDFENLNNAILKIQPDFIFHFAAQALVLHSYQYPLETINSNVLGFANVLQSIANLDQKCTVIMVTTDKCYENNEWIWGYREIDRLGGKDIYSASKACSEIIFHSYFHSFLRHKANVKIASVRAGNVIGGGDFAKDRIVVDCIKAWKNGEKVQIRNAKATRPWQYVLEPLRGYFTLALALQNNDFNGESFNFGPNITKSYSVENLIEELQKHIDLACEVEITKSNLHEANSLKLDCTKAFNCLGYEQILDFSTTASYTARWYDDFISGKVDMFSRTLADIESYCKIAKIQR